MCAQNEKKKSRGGYGVRSEAGEGDRVRCFRQRSRRGGGSMSSLCAEHELLRQRWQRHANRLSGAGTERGEGAWDVTCGGPTVCSLTQNRTSPLSWTGLLPALPLTLKKGFLCQRTSCTCRLKRLEVESTPNCGATKCNAHSGSVFIWSPPSFRAPFLLSVSCSLFF